MNHISSKWLKKLRWLFLLYCSHFIWIYLYLGLRYHEWHGTAKFPLEVVFLVGFQAIYEVYSSLKLIKKHTYIATVITAFLLLFETGIVFNPSGVYYSPYVAPLIIMGFVGGALGWFVPVAELATMVLFSLFGFAGFLASPVTPTLKFKLIGSLELTLEAIMLLAGYYFWRRYYDLSENVELGRLTSRLKRGTQQSTTILNSIGDGVIVFDASGAIDLINPPASAMTGYEVKDALGIKIQKVVKYSSSDPKTAETALPDYFATAIKEKRHLSATVRLNGAGIQRKLIVSLGISPIVIPPDNELVGGVAILHDVTREIEIEQQRSDFISTASHEMRTPIATIEGYLDIALSDKAGDLSPPMRGYLEEAHKATERLRELIENLFDNALKYTDKGKISFGVNGDGEEVEFYVRDSGSGIPADDLPHLFQKFYRVDNSPTRTTGGTGLGLFICRKIVELYGGHIWAESEVGKGSTFLVKLPRLSEQQSKELTASTAAAAKLAKTKPSIALA